MRARHTVLSGGVGARSVAPERSPGRRIVLLIGDPGAGKTTTCRNIVEIARHKDLRVAGLLSEASTLASGRVVQTVVNLRTRERRRLAEYVGTEEGEPVGRGVAGRFSWQFIGEAVRWGRHELQRCASGFFDLLVIDQIGPLELLAGSGWANAVEVLQKARFGTAVVVVNPLVVEELQRRIDDAGVVEVEVNDATRDLLPQYLGALSGWGAVPGRSLLGKGGPDCIVADLDGTLLDEAGELQAPGIVGALREAAAAGITLVVCTGRPTDRAVSALPSLGAEVGYVIAYGGGEIRDVATGEILARTALPEAACAAVLSIARDLGLDARPYDTPAGTLRLVLTGDAGKVERAAAAVSEGLGEAVCLLRPQPGVLAVQDAAATKEGALAALAARIGVDCAAVAYLGDAVDDAGALRWAGLGIAVEGDSEEAEAAADVVAPRSAVAEMLARLALARRLRVAG